MNFSTADLRLNAGQALSPALISHVVALVALGWSCAPLSDEMVVSGVPSRVSVREQVPGAECAYGGQRIDSGVDDNLNGVLDPDERDQVRYVCNGAPGSAGAAGNNGATALVNVEAEPAGDNCALGGNKLSSGLDSDNNGQLDPAEVSSVQYLCNGQTGAAGVNTLVKVEAAGSEACPAGGQRILSGSDADGNGELSGAEIASNVVVCNGEQGANGADGADGADGEDAVSALVRQELEGMGDNCEWGGSAIHVGLDTNHNLELDDEEIHSTSYVCNGADGLNSVFELSPATGPACANGGTVVETGLDLDRDSELDEGEVTASRTLCNGLDGEVGFKSLVKVSNHAAGPECAAGGKKLESGIDFSGDGDLSVDEVSHVAYLCNGVDGVNGEDGHDSLVNVSDEPPGANCALGGQKLEVGRDLDDDATLDAGEIEQTRFVCDGGGFLLRADNEEPGANCQLGGVKLETGADVNSNDVLDFEEVVHTDYVCNQNRADLFVPFAAELVAAGLSATCAASAGETYCWGSPSSVKPLGATIIPGFVGRTTLGDAQALSLGGNHGCALRNGAVWCWGANDSGQLGNDTGGFSTLTPVQAGSFTDAVAVSTGSSHTCALADGKVFCWGSNSYGQLGDAIPSTYTPTEVVGLTNVTAISAGGQHSCAVSNGNAFCWGYNYLGQLGDGTDSSSSSPVAVSGLTGVVAIQAGEYTTCALTELGTVACWGGGGSGGLGNGGFNDSYTPVTVSGLSGVTQLALKGQHACALAAGELVCWGYNRSGQLGDGSFTSSPTPVVVPGMSAATTVSAGYYHTCAIKDGDLWCWGSNSNGELGNGGISVASLIPTQVRLFSELAP